MVQLRTKGVERTERRVKLCSVPISTIVMLLNMNGKYSMEMDGWPEGCTVIGARVLDEPKRIEFVLFHPEFPIIIGQPPYIEIKARRV